MSEKTETSPLAPVEIAPLDIRNPAIIHVYSHDLRNPLSLLQGSIGMLEDESPPGENLADRGFGATVFKARIKLVLVNLADRGRLDLLSLIDDRSMRADITDLPAKVERQISRRPFVSIIDNPQYEVVRQRATATVTKLIDTARLTELDPQLPNLLLDPRPKSIRELQHYYETLLTAIKADAAKVLNFIQTPAQTPYVKIIKFAIEAIDESIFFFHPESLNLSVGAQPINLRDISSQRAKQVGLDRNIKFINDVPVDTVVIAHPLLKRAMINFLSNARKYAYHRVRGAAWEQNGLVAFAVSDDGRGIPPEEHQAVFQLGVQGSGAVAGSGVGLYIADNIVRRHHGLIGVDSQSGQGACFYFLVPKSPTCAINVELLQQTAASPEFSAWIRSLRFPS
ncbi:hypothetical protein HYU89_00040 [Candidatus Collierbacteria bacterium]|nr:hypothetical protein [Candidatus Collierbacteria bacterium]